jgi:hypothetical protein
MGSNWHGGKGSKPRPIKDQKQFDDNWDRIFGKKKPPVGDELRKDSAVHLQ